MAGSEEEFSRATILCIQQNTGLFEKGYRSCQYRRCLQKRILFGSLFFTHYYENNYALFINGSGGFVGNFIDQSLVYGDNKPYLVALLVLNSETSVDEKDLSNEIEEINKNLTKIEKIKKFFVIKEKFSIENGMMTPTLKLKRYKIIQKYKNQFEKLY